MKDLIERQAAIARAVPLNLFGREVMIVSVSELENLPSAQPERKTGHWIKVTNGRGGHECNLCHEYAPSYQSGKEYLTNYCPNCGAKMIEPQESEDKE